MLRFQRNCAQKERVTLFRITDVKIILSLMLLDSKYLHCWKYRIKGGGGRVDEECVSESVSASVFVSVYMKEKEGINLICTHFYDHITYSNIFPPHPL